MIFGEGGVEVVISDDGQGFTPQQAEARAQQGHLGLTGLRERVALAGENWTWTARRGRARRCGSACRGSGVLVRRRLRQEPSSPQRVQHLP